VGDFVGKRYATYTNDLDVPGYLLMSLNVSGKVPLVSSFLKNARWTISVTNLANRQGPLQPVVGQASGSYATYPIAPRMGYLTLKADI
jgi:outer membrane receptor protein involved in Fe transport